MSWINKIFEEINLRFLDYSPHSDSNKFSNETIIENTLVWFQHSAFEGCYASKYSMMWEKYFPALPESAAGWIPVLIRTKKNYPHIYSKVFGTSRPEEKIAAWLLSVQRPDGTFSSSYEDPANQPPAIFASGCIINGLLAFYSETGDEDMLPAILKSAEWLLKMQEADGSWQYYTYNIPHANTMTAYSLIKLGRQLNNDRFIEAGKSKIQYALKHQNASGAFSEPVIKSVHQYSDTIAFALTGIFLSAGVLGDESLNEPVIRAYKSLFNLLRGNGYLPGEINEEFKTSVNYCCLPGSCLFSTLGMLLYKKTGNEVFKTAAVKLLNYVKEKQLHSRLLFLDGGIPASWPISGKYLPYEINSTGVRIFMEALMEMEGK